MTKPKTILITGCSSGIGLRAAEMLSARGYQIFATARQAADVAKLKARGWNSFPLDLTDSRSIHDAVSQIMQITGGQLTALLNNAGYGAIGAMEDLTRDDLRYQFETNVFGLQELTNLIIPKMRQQGYGRIIHISSVLGLVSMPYRGAYCASKFAVEAMATALRGELRGSSIFVSLIEPGPIKSQFRENALHNYQKSLQNSSSYHTAVYQKLAANVTKEVPFSQSPDAVVQKIIHALTHRQPKLHYYVGLSTYLFVAMRRMLPTGILDWVLWRVGKTAA